MHIFNKVYEKKYLENSFLLGKQICYQITYLMHFTQKQVALLDQIYFENQSLFRLSQ